jgi:sulfate transport system permease protein
MTTQVLQRNPAMKTNGIGGALLAAGVMTYLAVLVIGPVVALVLGAFRKGASEAARALTSPDLANAFWLSLWIGLLVVAVQLILGTLTAWVLARHTFVGRNALNSAIDVPFAVSPVVVGYMLLLLFGRNTLLGNALGQFGIRVVFSVPGMVLATVFVTLPFMVREMVPVIRRLDREKELAAATLGAKPWTIFLRVTLPSLRAGMMYGMTLTFARALGEFGAVLVVGGGIQGRTETATLFVFRSLEERQYVEAYAAALALGACSVLLVTIVDTWRRRVSASAE